FSWAAVRIFENLRSAPIVNLIPVQALEVIESQARQLERLQSVDFDPTSSAVVSVRPSPPGTGRREGESPSSLDEIRKGVNRIDVRVHADGPSLLVLSEAYFPGWKSIVDGVPRPIVGVNLALMGVALDAGVHDVRFIFRPNTVYAGLAVSFFGGLCAAFLISAGRRL